MRYLSLFSGIGGFERGIEQAYEALHNRPDVRDRNKNLRGMSDAQEQSDGIIGINEKESHGVHDFGYEAAHRQEDPEAISGMVPEPERDDVQGALSCVGYSEVDKYAIQTYQRHYPDHINHGDITKINAEELPDFDLLVGGFPCQSFSIAGKRGGFSDTRGTLFFDIARIVKQKQPRLLFLENVKGLLSHDNGTTFYTIISTLDELGYDLQWQVLNSKNFGVPQNRERVFIVGHLRGTTRPEVFPIIGEDTEGNLPIKGGTEGKRTEPVRIRETTKKGYAEAEVGDSINLSVIGSKTRHGRVGKKIAQTLDTGMQQHTFDGMSIRRITPIECERLQGFPDNWTAGVSDTQRYKQCGNAVTVNVIEDIMKELMK